MAPPPEYDKEPKAPDKSATAVANEDSKVPNTINDLPSNSDHNSANSAVKNEAEVQLDKDTSIELIENLEDLNETQLRALLDEAVAYKSNDPKPKNPSKIFRGLLNEIQIGDEETMPVRSFPGVNRPNSLHDLIAIMKDSTSTRLQLQADVEAETEAEADVETQAHTKVEAHAKARAHSPLSSLPIHNNSLPADLDTSLVTEEPTGGGYFAATVKCFNPPPLAERRVTASDASCPTEMEMLNKRSKPVFPMYTARATLEIGSGSVGSGRAVTTTTASNQVRTSHPPPAKPRLTLAPPVRRQRTNSPSKINTNQKKLMRALHPKSAKAVIGGGTGSDDPTVSVVGNKKVKLENPRGPVTKITEEVNDLFAACPRIKIKESKTGNQSTNYNLRSEQFLDNVDKWYKGLSDYEPPQIIDKNCQIHKPEKNKCYAVNKIPSNMGEIRTDVNPNIERNIIPSNRPSSDFKLNKNEYKYSQHLPTSYCTHLYSNKPKEKLNNRFLNTKTAESPIHLTVKGVVSDTRQHDIMEYRKRVGRLERPSMSCNPRNIRNISIGKPISEYINNTEYAYIELDDISGRKQNSRIEPSRHEPAKECLSKIVGINQENRKLITMDIVERSQTGGHFKSKKLKSNVRESIDNFKVSQINDRFNKLGTLRTINTLMLSQNVNNNGVYTPETIDISQTNSDLKFEDVNGNDVHASDAIRTAQFSEPNLDTNVKNINKKVDALDTIDTIDLAQTSGDLSDTDVKSNKVNASYTRTLLHSRNSDNTGTLDKMNKTSCFTVMNVKGNENNAPNILEPFEMIDDSNINHDKSQKVETPPLYTENKLSKEGTNLMLKSLCVPGNIDVVECNQIRNDLTVKDMNSDEGNVLDTKGIMQISPARYEINIKDENSNNIRVPDSMNTIMLYKSNIDLKMKDVLCKKVEALNAVELSQICDDFKVDDDYGTEIETSTDITSHHKNTSDRDVPLVVYNNPSIFISLTKRLLTPNNDNVQLINLQEVENNLIVTKPLSGECSVLVKKKKKKVSLESSNGEANDKNLINRDTLKVLLFQSLFAQDSVNKSLGKPSLTAVTEKEVDAAIPFSSITTPEVVASCNTTSSTSQSAVAVDPKPLQLSSCYPAMASITWELPAAAASGVHAAPASAAPLATATVVQPRSVISSTFNGLPLSRPNYGATASAGDEYKKSLDENGNAVQGIGSPVSGSSQHKKPRRKKSSKNETVIKSHHIDGYQGNKDLNEVLRFIESNADGGRGVKLPRAKHKDDADDKIGKKRSAERRKDKDAKPKRATSMEELSRTKLEDLTDAAEPPRATPPPAKPERRSWGDGARDYFREPEPAAAAELTDFQTVTKRRKPRRRTDDGERDREPARRTRPPDRSDRSNDSNDDMDSVHSLPPAAPRATAPHTHASYADIARTRHNIPDLIESCNFYAEGEGGALTRRADRVEPAPAPIDADGYPALGGRRAAKPPPPAGAAACARLARDRGKERAPSGGAARPDVVADRRPPVILLDSTARPRDMDGVTFGFDINEQLLGSGGGARRPRCDLVREAAAAEAGAAVTVRAGAAALRYVPPDPPPDNKHLHQIVEYVGSAWEDVVRCGGAEVRYFSE